MCYLNFPNLNVKRVSKGYFQSEPKQTMKSEESVSSVEKSPAFSSQFLNEYGTPSMREMRDVQSPPGDKDQHHQW